MDTLLPPPPPPLRWCFFFVQKAIVGSGQIFSARTDQAKGATRNISIPMLSCFGKKIKIKKLKKAVSFLFILFYFFFFIPSFKKKKMEIPFQKKKKKKERNWKLFDGLNLGRTQSTQICCGWSDNKESRARREEE